MAETTIEWTRGPNGEPGFTFNPWWGCDAISPACDHCYAAAWAKRTGFVDLWSGERRFFGNDHWSKPLRWDARARHRGERYRVFCASMADVFDNHPEVEPHRRRLWDLIACTPHLDWLLLTKRIGNAKRMVPADWGDGYPNVWLGSTVVTQEEADRDVQKLLAVPARVHFLSCEPLLEALDLQRAGAFRTIWWDTNVPGGRAPVPRGIDWVIVGGESGHHARPMHPQWVRSLRDQCVAALVPFFFKQWGNFISADQAEARKFSYDDERCEHVWDASSPTGYSIRVNKKAAGRTLDGREWNEFPKQAST